VVGPQPTGITSVSRSTPLACRLHRVARSIRTERSSVPRVQSHIGVHTPHLPPGSRSNLPSAEADARASPFAVLVDGNPEPAREAAERTSGSVARAATGGSRQDLGPQPKARSAEQDCGAEVQGRNAPKVAAKSVPRPGASMAPTSQDLDRQGPTKPADELADGPRGAAATAAMFPLAPLAGGTR